MDESYGLICMSMSLEIFFHIDSFTTPNEVGNKLEGLFGKQDEMRGHMLKVELNSLDPRIFDNIQEFFIKFKALII
jgi:hypothetical protein